MWLRLGEKNTAFVDWFSLFNNWQGVNKSSCTAAYCCIKVIVDSVMSSSKLSRCHSFGGSETWICWAGSLCPRLALEVAKSCWPGWWSPLKAHLTACPLPSTRRTVGRICLPRGWWPDNFSSLLAVCHGFLLPQECLPGVVHTTVTGSHPGSWGKEQ